MAILCQLCIWDGSPSQTYHSDQRISLSIIPLHHLVFSHALRIRGALEISVNCLRIEFHNLSPILFEERSVSTQLVGVQAKHLIFLLSKQNDNATVMIEDWEVVASCLDLWIIPELSEDVLDWLWRWLGGLLHRGVLGRLRGILSARHVF